MNFENMCAPLQVYVLICLLSFILQLHATYSSNIQPREAVLPTDAVKVRLAGGKSVIGFFLPLNNRFNVKITAQSSTTESVEILTLSNASTGKEIFSLFW